MLVFEWNNPKITVTDLDLFLSNYLKDIYDGVVIDGNRLNILTKSDITSDQETYIRNWYYSLNGIPTSVTLSGAIDSNPFAIPSHRTKRNATTEIVTVVPNGCSMIDFKMIDERFVAGGELIIKNGQFGDYIHAEVADLDGLIPVPYRAALCENYPTVAKYIEKAWLPITTDITTYIVDTMPLTAKITTGLYLRVIYCANSDGIDRKVVMNYYLTKKL